MNKTLLILYNDDDWNLESPDYTTSQKFAYNRWGDLADRELNVQLLRASQRWFQNGVFKKYWKYNNKIRVWEKINGEILPTVVYDKSRVYDNITQQILPEYISVRKEIDKHVNVVNSPEFTELFTSKLNQSIIFKEFMPETKIIDQGKTLKNPDSDYLVIKNFYGSGGKQVNITNDSEVVINERSVIQKFIDGKDQDGKLQDIRIVFIGDEPQFALNRTAKEGSLYTNFHQGAKVSFTDLANVPGTLEICKKIIKKMEIFPSKVFSLDFLIESKSEQHYLMELNTMPGLDVFNESSIEIMDSYLVNLSKYLIR